MVKEKTKKGSKSSVSSSSSSFLVASSSPRAPTSVLLWSFVLLRRLVVVITATRTNILMMMIMMMMITRASLTLRVTAAPTSSRTAFVRSRAGASHKSKPSSHHNKIRPPPYGRMRRPFSTAIKLRRSRHGPRPSSSSSSSRLDHYHHHFHGQSFWMTWSAVHNGPLLGSRPLDFEAWFLTQLRPRHLLDEEEFNPRVTTSTKENPAMAPTTTTLSIGNLSVSQLLRHAVDILTQPPPSTPDTDRVYGDDDQCLTSSEDQAGTTITTSASSSSSSSLFEPGTTTTWPWQDLEPIHSVVYLLAHVLHLPWATGPGQLWELLEQRQSRQHQQQQHVHSRNGHLSARVVTPPELEHFVQLLQQRCLEATPLQYLVGQWDFLDHTYLIQPGLLCPRPETEELVLLVHQHIILNQQQRDHHSQEEEREQPRPSTTTRGHPDGDKPVPLISSSRPYRLLDVGCGTGCIGIALADRLEQHSTTRGQWSVQALDLDPVAVQVSLENAQRILGPNQVVRSDSERSLSPALYQLELCALEEYLSNSVADFAQFHVVVSNPPYIPSADMLELERQVSHHESRQALWGGSDDGLQVIRALIHQLPRWCAEGAVCFMEVDPSHPALLEEWLSTKPSLINHDTRAPDLMMPTPPRLQDPPINVRFVRSYQDLAGRERFVQLQVEKLPKGND